jgi:hypothetical protein
MAYALGGEMTGSAKQLWLLAAISGAMMALGMIWAMLEGRSYQETLVWVKPLKFALSFVVYFATLALVVGRLSHDTLLLKSTVWATAAAFWFEMIYITAQAAKGQASHYNIGDPVNAALYAIMGVGAVTLTLSIAVIGWMVLRDKSARFSADMRFGVGIGFFMAFGLTLITAATLASMSGHFVGIPVQGAAVIPFFGWSASIGDLRPSHFLALHAMQVIPLIAIWVQGRRSARHWIIAASVIYAALTMALYAQALMGLPIWRLS